MRGAVVVIIIIFVGGYLFFSRQFNSSHINTSNTSITIPFVSMTSTISNLKIINTQLNNENYVIYSLPILQDKKISLIANFTKKEFGQNIAEAQNCIAAINGGFYTKTDTPLGLFSVNGVTISKEVQSNLVNGFFWENEKGVRFIEKTSPTNTSQFHFIFQSGPFITVGNYQLKTVNDEMDRRSLIGKDGDNNFYIISITQKENSLRGPPLSDIPLIFSQETVQKELPLTQLLNLDGGSASFFYATDSKSKFVLSELTSIGSLLCIK